jgi:hypothetical protein
MQGRVGMLPFSIALDATGGVDLAAHALHGAVGSAGSRATLALLFTVTAAIGLFISNTATAIIMAPIAITLAEQLEASPLPFALTVTLACSTAFVTPVSSPVNMRVAEHSRHAHDVACCHRELEVLIDPLEPAVHRLADAADGLAPAEVLLDALVDRLADGVAGMSRGAAVSA